MRSVDCPCGCPSGLLARSAASSVSGLERGRWPVDTMTEMQLMRLIQLMQMDAVDAARAVGADGCPFDLACFVHLASSPLLLLLLPSLSLSLPLSGLARSSPNGGGSHDDACLSPWLSLVRCSDAPPLRLALYAALCALCAESKQAPHRIFLIPFRWAVRTATSVLCQCTLPESQAAEPGSCYLSCFSCGGAAWPARFSFCRRGSASLNRSLGTTQRRRPGCRCPLSLMSI